jgi:hypothetical protein
MVGTLQSSEPSVVVDSNQGEHQDLNKEIPEEAGQVQ